jgi:hypothetical protein
MSFSNAGDQCDLNKQKLQIQQFGVFSYVFL